MIREFQNDLFVEGHYKRHYSSLSLSDLSAGLDRHGPFPVLLYSIAAIMRRVVCNDLYYLLRLSVIARF